MNARDQIKAFLETSFRQHDFRDDDDIFGLGFVNSLFAMQLVNFVETTFGITVEDDELELDNFRTIEAMTALVGRKSA